MWHAKQRKAAAFGNSRKSSRHGEWGHEERGGVRRSAPNMATDRRRHLRPLASLVLADRVLQLGPVKENFNIAFAHFYILNVNQHSSNYLKHMLSTTGPISISTSATSRSQVVAHAEIAWTKRYE